MWPLKGRIYCGTCGRRLTPLSTRRGNSVYRYYRCRATAGGRQPCEYQVAAGTIEAAVADQLPRDRRDELENSRARRERCLLRVSRDSRIQMHGCAGLLKIPHGRGSVGIRKHAPRFRLLLVPALRNAWGHPIW
jgi:Recombinase zinc beta ribbon domain